MPFTFKFYPEKQLAHVRLVGNIEFAEFDQRRTEYINLGVPKYELVEMQDSDLQDISANKMIKHINTVRVNQSKPDPGSKTAVVFRDQVHVGLFRMLENINKSHGTDWPRECRFFKTKEEALAWLGLNNQEFLHG